MLEGINYELIERSIPFSEGYAQIAAYNEELNKNDQFDNYVVSATYYKRAAENTLLLSTTTQNKEAINSYITKANELLIKSAIQYEKCHYPYAVLLASIAGKNDYLEELIPKFKLDIYASSQDYIDLREYNLTGYYPWAESKNKPIKAVQYAYLLFTNWQDQSTLYEVNKWLYPFAHYRIGVLSISINQLINISAKVLEHTSNYLKSSENNLDNVMAPILYSYDEALQIASRDQYRFQRLAMDFHPVNAEILGLLIQINKFRNGYALDLIEKSSIRESSKVFLIQLINNMRFE